jgi:hypothetical protein
MRATALLPLHHGRAPRWLFGRMVKLAECIVEIIVHEYGVRGLLERLSDPWFFQSLSCVLGYDWHSSGTTTVTCGALKEAIRPGEHGIAVAGGKGKASRKAPAQIEALGQSFNMKSSRPGRVQPLSPHFLFRRGRQMDSNPTGDQRGEGERETLPLANRVREFYRRAPERHFMPVPHPSGLKHDVKGERGEPEGRPGHR